jgi:DNA polymerase-3 subunit beta
MKAVVSREGLLTALQHCSGVVPARSPKPVLQNVRLDFEDGNRCIATATDLDVGIKYVVSGVTVEAPGSILVPCGETVEILREVADETLRLDLDGSQVRITGLTSEFELPAGDSVEFPDVPDEKTGEPHRIKAGLLATLIRRTTFAAAAENTRYALNSVLLEFDGEDKVRMVATDGRRLAMMEGKAQAVGTRREGDTLLSPKSLAVLQKIPMDPEEEVEISVRQNDVLFKTAKVTIYSRLVEGKYPRYQDVFPPESKNLVAVLGTRFTQALRQAKIVTTADSRGVDFSFKDGQLTLTSRGKEAGRSEVRVPVGYDGPPLDLTFDPQLFIDALRVLEPETEITLRIADTRRATLMGTPDQYSYLVMPLTRSG